MIDTITVEDKVKELTESDRCDRCGSRAYFQMLKGELEFLLCAHHGRQHEVALVLNDWTVLDSTHLLEK